MKRILVYEYLSGSAPEDGDAAADALLPAGIAMRDAIVADLLRLPDCAVTIATRSADDALPPRAARVVPRAGEAAIDFVERAADGQDLAWIVAPETDGLLAALCGRIGPARWIGCEAAAIETASSKRATALRLAAHGVPTPLGFEADARVRHWVVKPDDGAGSVATCRHADRATAHGEFERRHAAGEAVVIEPWIDGEPMSLSLLCGHDGVELLSVNRQRIVIDAQGRIDFGGVVHDAVAPADPRRAQLSALAGTVAAAVPGLRGFVGIDLVWHDEAGPVVIEINPRVTCAYVGLSAALGRNLAALVLAGHMRERAREGAPDAVG